MPLPLIESANVLKVTMKFYGGYKYKSPSKRRRDRLRKKKFLAKFRKDPVLVPVPFLEPGQSLTLSLSAGQSWLPWRPPCSNRSMRLKSR